jgi:hypothetical protein
MQLSRRTFPLTLSSAYLDNLRTYLFVLRHVLERLGPDDTREIWRHASARSDPELLEQILSSGWSSESNACDVVAQRIRIAEGLFPIPVQGISSKEALRLLLESPPFATIERSLTSLNGNRQTTTYEALHLFRHVLACITECIIDSHGKAGELIIYDALNEELRAVITEPIPGHAFMRERLARYQGTPSDRTIHSAGLEYELIKGTEEEVRVHVTHCEWARYFLERHPSVGYLLACSLDDPAYRLLGRGVRFRRRCTLMEGGPYCEFHFYLAENST